MRPHIAYAPGPGSSGRSAKNACHGHAIKFRLLSHALRGLERDVAQGCVDTRSRGRIQIAHLDVRIYLPAEQVRHDVVGTKRSVGKLILPVNLTKFDAPAGRSSRQSIACDLPVESDASQQRSVRLILVPELAGQPHIAGWLRGRGHRREIFRVQANVIGAGHVRTVVIRNIGMEGCARRCKFQHSRLERER